jgi:mono/diheme cytochrome c family protein
MYPALAQNARLASWQYAAITVLNGRNAMPSFAPMLTDAEVADVVNYLRVQFGNHYRERVSGAQVASLPHPRGAAARE